MSLIPFQRGWFLEPWGDIDRFFGEWPEIKTAEFIPPMDVYEKKDKVIIETPIAGIDPGKVDISIEDNVLTIKGKSEKRSEVEEKSYYRQEVKYGSFYRAVSLPTKVKSDKAKANYGDGVLKIEIPKAPEVKSTKKVEIAVKGKK